MIDGRTPSDPDPVPDPAALIPPPPAAGPAISSRHRATLDAVFVRPTKANIRWRDVEALLVALGASVFQGRGSRVQVSRNGQILNIHSAHPRPDMKRSAVEAVRDFLTNQGITP